MFCRGAFNWAFPNRKERKPLLKKTVTSTLAIAAGLTLALFLFQSAVQACTGIQLKNTDGSIVNGRTLEFGIYIKTDVLVIPRGYAFTGSAPNGAKGKAYSAKYAVIGCDMDGSGRVADGLNEAGLAAGAFLFPDFAQFAEITAANQTKAVSSTEFPNYLLTQFASVDEVKKGLNDVVIGNTIFQPWGIVAPLHYVVYDKTGRSIVIEPIGGKLVVFDNPLGVLTNTPAFDWHTTNLRNYINLSSLNVAPVEIDGLKLKQLGQGSGMHGLPGDFTPPSRFVRAAVFSATAVPSPNAEEGIFQLFHILNNFDIPVGVSREKDDKGQIHTDYTMLTVARDPQNLRYYWRTYNDQNLKMVDLKKFDLTAKNIKRASTEGQQRVTDMTTTLK
jgi:choloylglycine hydrolase